MRVCHTQAIPFRPLLRCEIGTNAEHSQLLQLIIKCWDEDPAVRPDFTSICAAFKAVNHGK